MNVQLVLSIPVEIRLAALFVLGCCLGGLVNLGIYRLAWHPRPISPWSRPPAEAPRRRAWDRIPVIGWLGLRREANLYGETSWIWLRPMLIELFCGATCVFLYLWEVQWHQLVPADVTLPQFFIARQIGRPVPGAVILAIIRHEQFAAHIALFCFMLTAFWIDFDETTIPDGVTVPATLLGLVIVSAWPYALLPQENFSGPFGLPAISSVWLTSPDYIAPPPNNPQAARRYVQPWDVPAVTGRAALTAAIAGFWGWCFALVQGRWSARHGYLRAIRVFAATMRRRPANYGLLALALIGSGLIAWVWSMGGPHWVGLASGVAGIVVGGGLVWIIRIAASAVMQREAMGFGDVTLMAMIGAFLGWQAAIVVFFLAPFAGIVFAIGRLIMRGDQEIPFGPFLCSAAAAAVLFWPSIWSTVGDRVDDDFSLFSLHWMLLVVLLALFFLLVVLLLPIHWVVEWIRRAGSRERGAGSKQHRAPGKEHDARDR